MLAQFSHLCLSQHLSNNKLLTMKACSLTKYFFPPSCRGMVSWGELCAGPGQPRLCPGMAASECFSGAACQRLLFQDKDTTNGRHRGVEARGPSLGQRRRLRQRSWGTWWHSWDPLTSWWPLGVGQAQPSLCPSPETPRRPGPPRGSHH